MSGWGQFGLVVLLLVLAYRPLGDYMAWCFTSPKSLRVERAIYRVAGVDPTVEQRWTGYATSLLVFSGIGVLLLFVLQRVQGSLPYSLGFPGVKPDLAFNTAASFITNTNWQNYSGESTMGYTVQMSGLAVQNFVSAAVGIAVAIALIRGFTRTETGTIGNFWSDMVRATVRILLPIAFVFALVLVTQGAIQNFHPFQTVATVSGQTQSIPGGPVASQESIKELGTNGGGFFNANSAHPFENPSPFTNLRRDLPAPRDPVLAHRHLRQAREGSEAGLRARGRDGRALDRLRGDGVALRVAVQPRGAGGLVRAQHGGQGGPVRDPGELPVRGEHDRHVDRAP